MNRVKGEILLRYGSLTNFLTHLKKEGEEISYTKLYRLLRGNYNGDMSVPITVFMNLNVRLSDVLELLDPNIQRLVKVAVKNKR